MIRTPEQYVESLRDGRVVYSDGNRITDVVAQWPRSVEWAASDGLLGTLARILIADLIDF